MELTVIIIDDSELDRFIIKKIIQHVGKTFLVESFSSAQQALDTIKTNQDKSNYITLVLLDLRMPLMNGFQFIEEFEKLPIEIQLKYKIVILSSTRNPNDIARLLSYSCVDSMLEKPITKEKLHSIFARIEIGA